LAGPVAVGVVALHSTFDRKQLRLLKGKDSKKLTEAARNQWFTRMLAWQKQGQLIFSVTLVSHAVIDTRGISHAIKMGMKKSLRKVKENFITFATTHNKTSISEADIHVCLDGGLKAPPEYIHQKTIIRGDEKILEIGLASIAAKVTRDQYMKKISKKIPHYNFDIHKGYGTKMHTAAIKKHGPSIIHRISFLKKMI
jgi:ribonuclease HII